MHTTYHPSLIITLNKHIMDMMSLVMWLCALYFSFIFFLTPAFAKEIHLTPVEKDWIAKHSVIRTCVDPDYAPVEYIEEGQYKGISADYYALLEERLGLQFDVDSTLSWKDCLNSIKTGDIDLATAVKKTPQREEYLHFTTPYIHNDIAIITRVNSLDGSEKTIEDFNGKKVAVVTGYFYEDLLPLDYPDIEIVQVDSTTKGLVAVAFGSADAFFASYPIVTYHLKEKGITNLAIAGNTPYKTNYGAGIRKDWPILAGILNKGFKSISAEEHKIILSKWLQIDYAKPWYNKKLVTLLMGIAMSVLLFSLLWIVSLHRQVRRKTKELSDHNERLELTIKQRTQQLEDTNQKLRKLSEVDGITQVANRRFLTAELAKLTASSPSKHAFMVGMIDIDFFKQYNDEYGHVEGDKTLYIIAQTLKNIVEKYNGSVARYDSEEFAVVVPNTTLDDVILLTEQTLSAVRELNIVHEHSHVANVITISIGAAVVNAGEYVTPDLVLLKADEALDSAKTLGRNRCIIASIEQETHEP